MYIRCKVIFICLFRQQRDQNKPKGSKKKLIEMNIILSSKNFSRGAREIKKNLKHLSYQKKYELYLGEITEIELNSIVDEGNFKIFFERDSWGMKINVLHVVVFCCIFKDFYHLYLCIKMLPSATVCSANFCILL